MASSRLASKNAQKVDDFGNARQTINFTEKFTFGFKNKWSAINKERSVFSILKKRTRKEICSGLS